MSLFVRSTGKAKSYEMDELFGDDSGSFKVEVVDNRERERKIRREIANSNERRRMQSINSGFQALRLLIPHSEGEKLSKAAILQQTAEYIFALEQDKTRLLQQNTTLKRILSQCDREGTTATDLKRSPSKKAKIEFEPRAQNEEIITRKENNNDVHSDDYVEEIQKELIEMRCQLERERRLRITVEDKKRQLELDLAEVKSKSNVKSQKAPSTSRQNLDTIVQAIKHLEGDKTELVETPSKCKEEAISNAQSSSESASRRLVV
ncbi:transcription factor AP-4-like isoform X2 [Montipora capricornis]|uniref:transcription factor AP-4-like isoform X2 n=1 Tax=Montipora capricornis TaxID=246305 RepID=UPI0035F106C2